MQMAHLLLLLVAAIAVYASEPDAFQATTAAPSRRPTRRPTSKAKGTPQPTARATNPAPDPTKYNIVLKFAPGTREDVKALFTAAAAKWEGIITKDITDVPASNTEWFDGKVPGVKYYGRVDDLVIAAKVGKIDGTPSNGLNVLAYSGPVYVRGSMLPVSGIMFFDKADVQPLIDDGSFGDVILHEMGHILGVGSIWPTAKANCGGVCAPKSAAAYYTKGSTATCYAQKAAAELGLSGPLQIGGNAMGSGAQSLGLRQLCNELMTGLLGSPNGRTGGTGNPLSKITVGALQDLGYKVDYTMADAFDPTGCEPSSIGTAAEDTVIWGGSSGGVVRPDIAMV
ncbi:hypothetical protein JKP88DRAFT_350733 [Tribonema minus]|uniref:Uncharacterized protein n=1 Tax=Tribonema minus TaxID=303371 RepID=A0A835YL86_9STRA|nr:hypothetical protein JKP88DRAFT_350733 [Tribonema minus]